jgi:hypothetical protein
MSSGAWRAGEATKVAHPAFSPRPPFKPGASMRSRAQTAEMFKRIKRTQREADRAALDAQQEREADPLEQAKRFLRARGFRVFQESVVGGRIDRFTVGTREGLKAADLIARAERIGWTPKRTEKCQPRSHPKTKPKATP